jgi:TetR/AcrR family transcriptional repressor of nem operon
MARPREFDEGAVLDAAVECFWANGYDATSIRDLVDKTGITGASLYNAFGDKRALYNKALDHYVSRSVLDRIERCKKLPPREGVAAFLSEIVKRSLGDPQHKGCMLVNAALDVAPHDKAFQELVAAVLIRIETFFLELIKAGQIEGSIATTISAEDLARHLLGVLLGVRVLARVRPERKLFEGVVAPALSLLDHSSGSTKTPR